MYPSQMGWVWINFWWARASYIVRLVEPERSLHRRHYYEDYLGRLHDGKGKLNGEGHHEAGCSTCFSLCTYTSGKWYTPADIPSSCLPGPPNIDQLAQSNNVTANITANTTNSTPNS